MTSRRVFLSSSLAAGTGALISHQGGSAQDDGEEASGDVLPSGIGRALHPAWSFVLIQVRDPYDGQVDRLVTEDEDTRVVAMEVVIDNASEQPLSYAAVDVRVRTPDGVEHRAGALVGEESRLTGRNLKPGERARGWVWFDVPVDATLTEVVLAGPAPQWRVELAE